MREELVVEGLKLLGGILLILPAFYVASGVDLPLERLADFEVFTQLDVWAGVFFVAFTAVLGMYLLSSLKERKLFYAVWGLIVVLAIVSLNNPQLDDISLISILLGSVLMFGREVRGALDVWGKVRSERGVSSLVFTLVVLAFVLPNATYYNGKVLDYTLGWINTAMPKPENLSGLIDKMIPSVVTPEDMSYVMEYLTSMPEWNLLSEAERQALVERMREEILKQKEMVKNILKSSLSKAEVKLDRETLLALVSANEQLKMLLDHLFVFLILIALAIYSIVTEVATILAFLILFVPEFVRTRRLRGGRPCEEE